MNPNTKSTVLPAITLVPTLVQTKQNIMTPPENQSIPLKSPSGVSEEIFQELRQFVKKNSVNQSKSMEELKVLLNIKIIELSEKIAEIASSIAEIQKESSILVSECVERWKISNIRLNIFEYSSLMNTTAIFVHKVNTKLGSTNFLNGPVFLNRISYQFIMKYFDYLSEKAILVFRYVSCQLPCNQLRFQ